VILVEIRPRGGGRQAIAVHAGVTVVRGLDAAARRTWATDLARALRGETAASLDLEVEVDGDRTSLTPELVQRLGLGDAATTVTVFAVDLPGAKPLDGTAERTEPSSTPVDAEADVATAEADVRRLQAELADAERAATSAADALTAAGRKVDKQAAADVSAAEARLEVARAGAAAARQQLQAAEDVERSASDAERTRRSEADATVEAVRAEAAALEERRAKLVVQLTEAGMAGDPKPVEQALAGLRRLRSVKPKPSAKAVELADRWAEARDALQALPQPPQPPEWLVTPALAALQEAREALAEAQSGGAAVSVDPAKVDALDRAHREVLEAEQRAMKKGSRLNRRRLDAAHEAEQVALAALGVKTYGEYLQRIAPALEGGASTEDRIAAAKAAVADAEAVWEELHGGQASPEWTAAKERQAAVRIEAHALVGEDVDDADLEDRLRSHLETVVDTEWAEQALAKALADVGATPPEGDLEGFAESWLADAPAALEARTAVEAELSEVDGKLAALEERLAELGAEASSAGEESAAAAPAAGPLAALRKAAEEADRAEAEATAALATARDNLRSTEDAQGQLATLEQEADARRNEVDRLRAAVAEAEVKRDEVQRKAAEPATAAAEPPAAAPARERSVDLAAVVGMEAEAYLLARVSALRGAPGGPLPLVVDGEAVGGLSDGAGRRVRRLLGRLAGSMQVVVLADDDEIASWAEGLGDQAAVRDVAR
jgi:chromosome segregation protein